MARPQGGAKPTRANDAVTLAQLTYLVDSGTTPPDPANPKGSVLYIYINQTNNTITVYRWT